MYLKKTNAGTIFKNNTGKITIGLVVYDIAMVKNDKHEPNSPPYKLIQYKPNSAWKKTLCGLFMQNTDTKSYYQGDINLGFGIMRVQLWKNEQPKNEKSPAIYITAQLLSQTNQGTQDFTANGSMGDTAFENGVPIEYEGYGAKAPGTNSYAGQTYDDDDNPPF